MSRANDDAGRAAGDDAASRQRPRRELSSVDRYVRVPLGLVWLGLMALLAVPVIVYMTVLYYVAQGAQGMFRGRRSRRAAREISRDGLA